MNDLRALILGLIVLQSCSFVGRDEREEIRPIRICGIKGFTELASEHITNEIRQPIVVRSVKGKITNEQGGWPEGISVLFEIRRTGEAAEIIQAIGHGEGHIEIPGVPEGTYCFKATAGGWRSVMGIIKVDKRADPKKTILIVMDIE